jgi:hypothetical protein
LANLGHQVSDQTVGNILRRHGIGPVRHHVGGGEKVCHFGGEGAPVKWLRYGRQ